MTALYWRLYFVPGKVRASLRADLVPLCIGVTVAATLYVVGCLS